MKKLWFKRKLYGWGWTPVTWEGWFVIGVYVALVIFFAFSIDEQSSVSEIAFTFILPVAILSVTLIRLCYRMGERPKWQWGTRIEDTQK